MKKRIVLLHATKVAFAPIQQAFNDLWPEAEIINILDESLSIDRAKEEDLSQELIARFVHFGFYADTLKPDGILITCSAFGPAIDLLATNFDFPVVKPNEAMFQIAFSKGRKIGMLATFEPAIQTMHHEFTNWATHHQIDATLKVQWVPEAMDALRAGNEAKHNELIAAYAEKLSDCDVILLAHFSTSLALAEVQKRTSLPVLTAPHSAVNQLRNLIDNQGV